MGVYIVAIAGNSNNLLGEHFCMYIKDLRSCEFFDSVIFLLATDPEEVAGKCEMKCVQYFHIIN